MKQFSLKSFAFLTLIGLSISLSGCVTTYGAPSGSIYMETSLNKDVTTPSRIGSKDGTACARAYLGIIATGDASLKAAAALGGISEVKAVDYRISRTLGSVVAETCTIAHGD